MNARSTSGLNAVCAAVPALFPGCGGGDDEPVTPQQALAEPCRLLEAEEVAEILGTPISTARDRVAVGALEQRGCEYGFEDDDAGAGAAYGLVDTGWRPQASIGSMRRAEGDRSLARPAGSHETLDGLGDQAFLVPPHESLVVRAGDVALVVDVGRYRHAHGSREAHQQLLADTRELAERALARLEGSTSR